MSQPTPGGSVQSGTAAGATFPSQCTMAKMSAAPVVLLVQPSDGLQTYADFLCGQGLSVIGVSNACDALTAARKADVLVTAVLLPGSMDGVELIARLRRDEGPHRRPIIVLTACAWRSERE